ncbi:hypothetical protein CLAFUW4_02204 [Fulvia fulva]|uniref:Uncharacterized protein n=1 Tax=Passalora fulva TaxID=5499 RepID=A0A9Q8L8P6_PASFU|nr:uncharacterized protein CLAFUR5_02194 [Fulvia fulva]KAK4636494.1 hypothetical protein CLAFUR0_02202 [Fulvia fulva]UJO12907.1 hypothetical protein CLAFUR5_02194 [Fulvia fulva]WPV08422.1 hypothetical protein CLAFUW4_02204 [Fulvia fulva]
MVIKCQHATLKILACSNPRPGFHVNMEPLYSFTIPSIEDDTPLDCRIYHDTNSLSNRPGTQLLRGAVLAHPYPPLGGCYDDPVVLALTETLLADGYIIATFNFRGAGESAGRTSWTGNSEVLDYCSVVGLLFYYLQDIQGSSQNSEALTPIISATTTEPNAGYADPAKRPFEILLGGYSFGALILARLPPVSSIINRFEAAERGTAACEIILRARKLATQLQSIAQEVQSPIRGRNLIPSSPHSPHHMASPVTFGGEETDASDRRRSRDSRRSVDVVREVGHRMKPHLHRHSGNHSNDSTEHHRTTTASSTHSSGQNFTTAYLLVSPVLLPLTTTICPPGLPFPGLHNPFHGHSGSTSGLLSLQAPVHIIFGNQDGFTSVKKLQQWATKLCKEAPHAGRQEIAGAAHFWREEGAMRELQSSVATWVVTLRG